MKNKYILSIGYKNYPDLSVILTCGACPEQYDVFYKSEPLGYLRLRHGFFRADYYHCGGNTVYKTAVLGNGIFEPHERDYHLNKAIYALLKERKRRKKVQNDF